MKAIFIKELRAYFTSFYAIILASLFTTISGLFLWFFANEWNIFELKDVSLTSFFFIAPWLLLFLVPAITMRQLSEEKQLGTLEWLRAQPLNAVSIILGKYFSALIVILFCILPTLIYVMSVYILSIDARIDLGTIASGYLGVLLLGITFCAIGLLVSSTTKNQVIAYVFSLSICFIFYYGLEALSTYDLLGSADYYIRAIGIKIHYDDFVRGIIDTKHLFYFLIITVISLYLTYYNFNTKSVL